MKRKFLALVLFFASNCAIVDITYLAPGYDLIEAHPTNPHLSLMTDSREHYYECDTQSVSCTEIFKGIEISSARYSKQGGILAIPVYKKVRGQLVPPMVYLPPQESAKENKPQDLKGDHVPAATGSLST